MLLWGWLTVYYRYILALWYSNATMGFGFGDIFSAPFNGIKDTFSSGFSGVKDVFQGGWDSVVKPVWNATGAKALDRIDRISNLADRTVDAAGNVVGGIGDLFKGNVILYIALAGAGLIILPKLLDRVL